MKDFIEQYEQEVTDILQTKERKRAEYLKFKEEKRAEIAEVSSLIDDALSEDNLEKVEQLTIRKTGLEMFLKTLEERNANAESPAQKKQNEERGSSLYHGLISGLKDADVKELEECKALLEKALKIAENGATRRNRAQAVVSKWTSKISTIDGAGVVSIDTELNDLYNKLKRVMG